MNSSINRNIQTRLLSHLFDNKFGIYLSSFGGALVYSYILYSERTAFRIYLWLFTFLIYLILRYAMTSYYRMNLSRANNEPFFFEKLNICIAAYGGAVWGISSFLFFPIVLEIEIIIALAIYTGVAAGSLTTNAASFKSSLAFIFSMFIPAILSTAIYEFQHHYYISACLILAVIGYLKGAKVIYNSLFNSVKISLENQSLVNQVIESNAKRLEAERNSLQSSKLATVGEMAAGIAHEVNNPLAIISGNLEMIKLKHRKESLNFEYTKYFDTCEKNILRITSLVKSLKRMSYDGNDSDKQEVSLDQVLEDAFSFTKEKLKANRVDFSINIKNTDIKLFCNSLHMSQVLLNLVNNAVHAISSQESPWIKLDSYEDDEFLYIEVVDSGNGIPRHIADKIFNPFFTTKDINTGTGLGLSLSRTMAKNSGGDLMFDFNSKNTKFILTVPKSKEKFDQSA